MLSLDIYMIALDSAESVFHNTRMSKIVAVCAFALSIHAVPASALTLTGDYSMLSSSGSVYQNAAGQLFETAGAGRADVTSLFQSNVSASFTYLQNSLQIPSWNHTVTFKLFDFAAAMINADGDSQVTGEDGNGRTSSSTIRIDSSASSHFLLDPTPFDNSEYNLSSTNAMLGGGTVNVARFGMALSGGPGENRTDLLTLFLHETMHSIGITDIARFENLPNVGPAGMAGGPNRNLVIPTSLTGFSSNFNLPFLSASPHIDTFANGGLFARTVTSEPGFGEGDRALPTGVEIYALALINGAGPGQFNTDLVVPEPSTVAFGMIGVLGFAFRRIRNSRNR